MLPKSDNNVVSIGYRRPRCYPQLLSELRENQKIATGKRDLGLSGKSHVPGGYAEEVNVGWMAKIGIVPGSKDGVGQPTVNEKSPFKSPRQTEMTIIPPSHSVAKSPVDSGERMEGFDQVVSLFTSVRNQSVEFQCQFAKATADWTLALNLLTGRVATLEPLLNETLKLATDRQRSVEQLSVANKEYKIKFADSERELSHFRPMALQLDEELRVARDQLEDAARNMRSLEAENVKATGEFNDLFQKLATAETVNERVAEENFAYSQKLSESDGTIQSLMRETAQLKSDLTSATGDLERAEIDVSELAQRLATEAEELKRVQAALDTAKLQTVALKKEAAAHIEEAKEREYRISETLVAKDKLICDLEVKLAGVNSKNDFMNRMLQRMRDDLRRHLAHIGTLESSNRQLLDALSRNSAAATDSEEDAEPSQRPPNSPPKLRAVPD